MPTTVKAVGAKAENSPIEPLEIQRRDVLPEDVRIGIEYSGICHSDIHTVRGDWGDMPYPVVPGHEIIGRVLEVGSNVTRHKVGDLVGVGVIVNSCGECENCLDGDDHFCQGPGGPLLTFGEADPYTPGAFTQGG